MNDEELIENYIEFMLLFYKHYDIHSEVNWGNMVYFASKILKENSNQSDIDSCFQVLNEMLDQGLFEAEHDEEVSYYYPTKKADLIFKGICLL